MSETLARLIEAADKQSSADLIGALDATSMQRDECILRWRHGDTDVEEEMRALSTVCAAMLDVLFRRHPKLDGVVDDWCEANDLEDDRTMARYVVDCVMDKPEVLA